MRDEQQSRQNLWTLTFLGILLTAAALIGIGSLELTHWTSQNELATGSQSTPSMK